MIKHTSVATAGQGLYEITDEVVDVLRSSDVTNGLCVVFLQHTSASLLIQENADPSARHDLERWLNRLVPERDAIYTHTSEGPDDMPAHIKSMLTSFCPRLRQGQKLGEIPLEFGWKVKRRFMEIHRP